MSGNDSPNDAPAPHQKSRRTQPARTYQHTHAVHVARGGAAPPPPPPRGDVRPRSMCAGRGAGGTGGRGSCRRRPPVPRPSRDLLSSRPLTTQSRRVSAYLGISRHISAYLGASRRISAHLAPRGTAGDRSESTAAPLAAARARRASRRRARRRSRRQRRGRRCRSACG